MSSNDQIVPSEQQQQRYMTGHGGDDEPPIPGQGTYISEGGGDQEPRIAGATSEQSLQAPQQPYQDKSRQHSTLATGDEHEPAMPDMQSDDHLGNDGVALLLAQPQPQTDPASAREASVRDVGADEPPAEDPEAYVRRMMQQNGVQLLDDVED